MNNYDSIVEAIKSLNSPWWLDVATPIGTLAALFTIAYQIYKERKEKLPSPDLEAFVSRYKDDIKLTLINVGNRPLAVNEIQFINQEGLILSLNGPLTLETVRSSHGKYPEVIFPMTLEIGQIHVINIPSDLANGLDKVIIRDTQNNKYKSNSLMGTSYKF